MLYKIIGVFVGLAISTNVIALDSNSISSAGFSNLNEQQKAEIIKMVADKAAQNTHPLNSVSEVDKWAAIGERIGKGVGAAAKELGVAANEFVNTPVGRGVALLVVWHFFGSDIMHLGIGILVMIVGLYTMKRYVHICRAPKYRYDPEKKDIFGRSRLIEVDWSSMSEGETIISIIGFIFTMGASIGIMFGG